MGVILKDIDLQKRKSSELIQQNELKEMSFYIDMAKKCISMFSGPSFIQQMLNNEDAISHVAEHIMWGHMRWDEKRGRTLKSYLNQCGLWAIKIWKTKVYNLSNSGYTVQSLNHPAGRAGEETPELSDIIPDENMKTPHEHIYEDKLQEAIKQINSGCLTELQRKCIESRYLEGKKLRQIAEVLHVSRQAVNQHIKKGLKKLRKQNGICER